jgi:hypothetical protein
MVEAPWFCYQIWVTKSRKFLALSEKEFKDGRRAFMQEQVY